MVDIKVPMKCRDNFVEQVALQNNSQTRTPTNSIRSTGFIRANCGGGG